MKPTPMDAMKVRHVHDAAWDEAGGRILWAVRSWKEDRWAETIRDGKTDIAEGCSPVFLPDGTLIYRTEQGYQVHGQLVEDAVSCVPSPDGKRLLFACETILPGESVPEGWKAPIVADGGPYRSDADGGWLKKRRYALKLMNRETGELRTLTEGTKPVKKPGWSRDGKRVRWFAGGTGLHEMDADGGEIRELCKPSRVWVAGVVMELPDGRLVTAGSLSGDRQVNHIILLDPANGEEKLPGIDGDAPDEVIPSLTGTLPVEERNLMFCALEDGSFAVVGQKQGVTDVYVMQVEGERLISRKVTDGQGSWLSLAPCGEGALLAVRTDWQHPAEVVRLKLADGSFEAVSHENDEIAARRWGSAERLLVPSLDGKVTLNGWILLPADAQEKVPVVLLVHGGPQSSYCDAYNRDAVLLAAAGYAVILCNPRGSTGCGDHYGTWDDAVDGTAANDLLVFMDECLRRYDRLDPNRLAVAGGSYGGYMAAWMAGHVKRFRTAVVQRALLNFELLCMSSMNGGMPHMFDEPQTMQDWMLKQLHDSPTSYAQSMDIPMLILHGERDSNCPVDGAHMLYVGVKDTHPDLPVRLVLFPEAGHSFGKARPDYMVRFQQETLDWLARYL